MNSNLTKENFSFGYIDETYSFVGQSYKENGKVYINGYFHKHSPTVGMATCAFVPSGFRPKVRCGSAGYTDDDYSYNQIGAIKITTNGDVTLSFPTVYSRNLYISMVYDVAE